MRFLEDLGSEKSGAKDPVLQNIDRDQEAVKAMCLDPSPGLWHRPPKGNGNIHGIPWNAETILKHTETTDRIRSWQFDTSFGGLRLGAHFSFQPCEVASCLEDAWRSTADAGICRRTGGSLVSANFVSLSQDNWASWRK